jgi:hypothetical protein
VGTLSRAVLCGLCAGRPAPAAAECGQGRLAAAAERGADRRDRPGEQVIGDLLAGHEGYAAIQVLPGIGPVLAALFCWENGQPPHPDTITRRFKRLAAAAGLPEIDLHAVRDSYATAGRNAKIDWKALSKRIDHADVAFTMKQYVQTDLEADRQVASTLAELIIGGALASIENTDSRREGAA